MNGPSRVLVTGASGFIGDAVCTRLRAEGRFEIRGHFRTPSNAARLARLGIELAGGDLADAEVARRLVADRDIVIHCAVSSDGGARRARASSVKGTQNLSEAAAAAGVRRFVHLSSVAVHGYSPGVPVVTETTPTRRTGNAYADGKLAVEKVVDRAIRNGLPATILRPTIVYGPWSRIWVSDISERLQAGEPVLLGDGGGPANTVFIDNLVDAILVSMEHPGAIGETFIVSDDDSATWGDYLHGLADAMGGVHVRALDDASHRALVDAQRERPFALARDLAALVRSPEAAALARRAGRSPALRRLARRLLAPVPSLKRRLQSRDAAAPPDAAPASHSARPLLHDLFEIQRAGARASSDKLRSLGWSPRVNLGDGLARTADWMRWCRLAPQEGPPRDVRSVGSSEARAVASAATKEA